MNKYVHLYADSLEKDPNDKFLLYRVTAHMIAKFGTIEDLQALDNYFEKRMGGN